MFDKDSANNVTRRFGGIEFLPPAITVRSYGERGSHISIPTVNQTLYNDFVPLIYGTGWYEPPVVFARNDGNLTHMEVLLGVGPITSVLKVVVNDVELPAGVAGSNMTATGWYNLVSLGGRSGAFNLDFCDAVGNTLGDPYGSMAFASVVVPNNISNGLSIPTVQVLVQGLILSRFDASGKPLDRVFTNNSAWVLLDVLLRAGWALNQIDLSSFAKAAQVCDTLIETVDLNGNSTMVPRYQCNLLLKDRRSAGDVVRGIRNGSGLYLVFGPTGLLQLQVEDVLAQQQTTKPAGSNSTQALNGGWPAYEFGDNAFSGIARERSGASSLKVTSRSTADCPNRYTVEFQDEFNHYQQDSLSLVATDDLVLSRQEVTTSLTALGLPNFSQAARASSIQLCKSIYGNTYIDFATSVKGAGLKPGDLITLTYTKEGFDRQPFRINKISPGLNFYTAVISAQIHDDAWYSSTLAASGTLSNPSGCEIGMPRPLVGATFDNNGVEHFSVTESSAEDSDGGITCTVSVGFKVPAQPSASGAGRPLVGLGAQINSSGGTLAGGQTFYYAVSAVDVNGSEGALSFVVMANVPAATNTNQVALVNLSFTPTATSFCVYRGLNPIQLLRIATALPIANQFTDGGVAAVLQGPPDYNYDHANFYWRLELQPEEKADIQTANTIGNSALNMPANEYAGTTVRILEGMGAGQERTIGSNNATTLTVTSNWSVVPDATSTFVVADSTWQFGASGSTSPVSFVVPNREGATIHITGRAANVRDQENSAALSILTRWRLEGSSGADADSDVPGPPTFAIYCSGQGGLEIVAVGFSSLNNTRSIAAGTITIAYYDELKGPSSLLLAAAVGPNDNVMSLSAPVNVAVGDLIQIETEVISVQQAATDSTSVTISRASHGSTAAAHAAQSAVYLLARRTFVMAFAPDFFGSPASGNYTFPISMPDVRIAAAELFMTNSRGNSAVTTQSFTLTTDSGLRTLTGGQISIQIEGPLAIQSNAAPPVVMETAHSVRDVFAVVQQAPTGAPITLQITQNGQPYCQLTISVNATISDIVDGFALGPIQTQAQIGLDVLSVAQTSGTSPGSDLTVTIRL